MVGMNRVIIVGGYGNNKEYIGIGQSDKAFFLSKG